jgi:membrane-bound metal-dependent hydrolase YbcI (DUF457 family)
VTSAIGYASGCAGGVLPDILEPASNPHHRKFFHSKTTAVATAIAGKKAILSKQNPILKSALVGAAAGYGSHLVLDSKTPKGLPLI